MPAEDYSAFPSIDELLKRCLSIDLEVRPRDNHITSFAGVQGDAKQSVVHRGGNIDRAYERLDRLADAADFLLGHNIIFFDAPQLEAANKGLRLLNKPLIDTLRLNPLAFPRNPYHRLVKHYQDGRLNAEHVNDPELDAKLVIDVLRNQVQALKDIDKGNPDATCAYHYLNTSQPDQEGFDAVFSLIRQKARPSKPEAVGAIRKLLHEAACRHQIDDLALQVDSHGWGLAYALSWISVAGGDSVMAPWVRHQFPAASQLVRRLRNTACDDKGCAWCRSQNDPKALLKQWFGHEGFRPQPAAKDGGSLQEGIVAAAMKKASLLGILPTGTGKSICYQIPALSQFHKTGALTVVISPLVALMTDQVESMKRQGIDSCVTINGTLSLPERQEALDRVRLGDAAILLISPEQLRNPSVRSILKQREVGYWVLDEAHCISKWGHDFRPDYLYVARYIKEYSGDEVAPIVCLTATAKPSVISEIIDLFKAKLNVDLALFDGGSVRSNLSFEIIPSGKDRKHGDLIDALENALPKDDRSGAIIYCSTRAVTEQLAAALRDKDFSAAHYHAGLKPEEKREVQQQFADGELRIIVATNAFGMGIDKPDIRLVVHADIPGSLENYLQEAGRAGRDGDDARCILLFSPQDIERQFSLSAHSRLERREINAILKSLRHLDKRTGKRGEVVATSGEIVKEERDYQFERDTATDDTRVKTAVSWLEESVLLQRNENSPSVFPSSLRIRTVDDAKAIIEKRVQNPVQQNRLIAIVRHLISSPPDVGITTDELCSIAGISSRDLIKALEDLETMGIASNDTIITVYMHIGIKDSSQERLRAICGLEADLIEKLQELAPDMGVNDVSQLNLQVTSQKLRDAGHASVRPDIVEQLVRGIARDGRDESNLGSSLRVRKRDRKTLVLQLQRNWGSLKITAEIRRKAGMALIAFLQQAAPPKSRGKDIQVETTLGKLMATLSGDMELQARDTSKLLHRSLLWLHEQKVITLGKGLTIFRQAMMIKVKPGRQQFTEANFAPLQVHYQEQTLQTHIMGAYAERGLKSMPGALRLAEDYFVLDQDTFLDKWLPKKGAELRRQTTPESWNNIVGRLANPKQSKIVTDDREQTNVLVLAGPGSGKTRVLVHRIAYLVRIKRERPRGILVLVYNRHAAVEIRKRLVDLIGKDEARHVTISTCHGFAMRVVGASFLGLAEKAQTAASKDVFQEILRQATRLLRGDDLPGDEAEALRDTLIDGYRWILVDEYQDIGEDEYQLIAAVAGRSMEDKDSRLSLFAVGDDDQNIYEFKGSSVEYIRRFEEDYQARPSYLIENYRSSAHIIRASNLLIAPAAERMKAGQDIIVNRGRKNEPPGGVLENLDGVGRGRVQIFQNAGNEQDQAMLAVEELLRLSDILPDWDWSKTAIIGRKWQDLDPARSYCEFHGIPVQSANMDSMNLWRLRETQRYVRWLNGLQKSTIHASDIAKWANARPDGPWWSLLKEGINEFVEDIGDREVNRWDALEWTAEWSRSAYKRQSGLLLSTAHSAKGLEFEDVVVLDGEWARQSKNESRHTARRLYYVAMTRAKRSLTLLSRGHQHPFLADTNDAAFLVQDKARSRAHGAGRGEHSGQPSIADSGLAAYREVYKTVSQKDIDLGFAGRLEDSHPSIEAIDRLAPDDPLHDMRRHNDRWELTDASGHVVCRLAKSFSPPPNADFVRGKVYAVLTRNRGQSGEGYQSALKREEWCIVIPELVFRPR